MRAKIAARLVGGLFAIVAPFGVALGAASSASADPDLCVSGPFGYVEACVQAPGWAGWYDGPYYGPRWHDGWGHGDDDQGEDD